MSQTLSFHARVVLGELLELTRMVGQIDARIAYGPHRHDLPHALRHEARQIDGDVAVIHRCDGAGAMSPAHEQAQAEVDGVGVDDEVRQHIDGDRVAGRRARSRRIARSRTTASRTPQRRDDSPALPARSAPLRQPARPAVPCVAGRRASRLGAYFGVHQRSRMPCPAITGIRTRESRPASRTRDGRCATSDCNE